MRAVAYARFSSDNQRDESIDAQLRAIHEFAEREGMTIVAEYKDRARSATSDNRPAFLRMIADSREGGFDAVIVHKLDRFSRNRFDSAHYKKVLKRNGVRLLSALERIDGSPESIIMESVLEGMAEFYSANLAREVMKGMKESAYQGRFLGGRVLYGYKVVNGKYEVDEREAAAVRAMFELFANGASYSGIIAHLDAKGMKTRRGESFKATAIHEMIRNERYSGVYIFNQAAKGSSRRRKPSEEVVRIEGGMPAIIDDATWRKCNARREAQAKTYAPGRASPTALLAGILYCAACGGKMHKTTIRSDRGYEHVYYRCGKKCGVQKIPAAKIDDAVLRAVMERIYSPTGARGIAKRLRAMLQDAVREARGEAPRIDREIRSISQRIDKLLDALESGASSSSVITRLHDLERQQSVLERARMDITAIPGAPTEEELYRRIRANAPKSKTDPTSQVLAVRACIERIDAAPLAVGEWALTLHLFSFLLVAAGHYQQKAKLSLQAIVK